MMFARAVDWYYICELDFHWIQKLEKLQIVKKGEAKYMTDRHMSQVKRISINWDMRDS